MRFAADLDLFAALALVGPAGEALSPLMLAFNADIKSITLLAWTWAQPRSSRPSAFSGFRSGAGEGVIPSRLTRTVPGVGIGAIPPVAMVLALSDHAMINQGAERPTLRKAGRIKAAGLRTTIFIGVSRIKIALQL